MTVYAVFDSDDQCLYVGQTARQHPALRWAEHVRNGATWTERATRFEVLDDATEHAATIRLEPEFSDPRYADRRPTPCAGLARTAQEDLFESWIKADTPDLDDVEPYVDAYTFLGLD